MVASANSSDLLETVEESSNEMRGAEEAGGHQGASLAVGQYPQLVLAHG